MTTGPMATIRQPSSRPRVRLNPDRLGLVKSPNHPGGNMTGLATLLPELEAKSLQLLAELVPGLNRVAVLLNPENLLTT